MPYAIRITPHSFGKKAVCRLFKEKDFSLWNIFGFGVWMFNSREYYLWAMEQWKEIRNG